MLYLQFQSRSENAEIENSSQKLKHECFLEDDNTTSVARV